MVLFTLFTLIILAKQNQQTDSTCLSGYMDLEFSTISLQDCVYAVLEIPVYVICCLLNLFYTIKIIQRLHKRGTSQKLQKYVCIRYVALFLLLIPFYLSLLLRSIIESGLVEFNLADKDKQSEENLNEAQILQIVLVVFGTLKALIRLIEPFVYHTYLSMAREMFTCCCKNKSLKLKNLNQIRKQQSSLNTTEKSSDEEKD